MALGWPHPDSLLEHLSASQLTDWQAYFDEEPFGEHRSDLRMAVMLAHLCNALGAKRRLGGAFQPSDFVPYLGATEDPARLSARLSHVFERMKKHGSSRR